MTTAERNEAHLKQVLPELQEKARRMLELCTERGLDVQFYCSYRSHAEQEALYAQGRKPLAEVNELRKKAGLAALPEGIYGKVTNAIPGKSKHGKRMALDGVILDGGKAVWNTRDPRWQIYGECAREAGLVWAGDWKSFREFPHIEV